MVWNYGVELSMGHPSIPPNATDRASVVAKTKTFNIIRDDFKYEREQKVGIAIYSDICATPSTLGEGLVGVSQEEDLERIYGKPRQVTIYTGRITTFVGKSHIEYEKHEIF
jgi:hypothetical protein